ncbi:hypothetical protein ACOJIV_20610 [Haloarcula sp. AONF1]
MGRTTISISDELADELYSRKGRGESYEDVLWRLLDGGGTVGSDTQEDGSASVEPATDHETEHPSTLDELIDSVSSEVLPGSGSKLDERRDALRAVVEYLREAGTASPADFQREVYPEHRAHYTSGENPERSWWKNCIYKGLSELAERTDEIVKPDTTGEWEWRSD